MAWPVQVIKYESAIHEFDPYPLGRVIDGTVYPGVTLTAGTLWCFRELLTFAMACITESYIEVKGTGAGLTAAILLAMVNYITVDEWRSL
ncbi:hypothetical protein D5086_013159 [Populus alba]|uniref:Uncharacterized protein n=1 Tax=Populus alba TaxID=43335 RepID=A0ACC4C616_POPAL